MELIIEDFKYILMRLYDFMDLFDLRFNSFSFKSTV